MTDDHSERLQPHGPYIGVGAYGDIALYNSAGASLLRDAFVFGDHREARRAVRAVRRYLGGPTRILVTVSWSSYGREHEDSCEVYGWRAALVAARAMRAEIPNGWRVCTLVYDARLQRFYEPGDDHYIGPH